MDIKGYEEIYEVLETGLAYTTGKGYLVHTDPRLEQFRPPETPLDNAAERFKHLDIITDANPSRVLELLHRANLLNRGYSYTGSSPQLKLLGMSNKGRGVCLSFEDTTEN
jgi:hypothetical protein